MLNQKCMAIQKEKKQTIVGHSYHYEVCMQSSCISGSSILTWMSGTAQRVHNMGVAGGWSLSLLCSFQCFSYRSPVVEMLPRMFIGLSVNSIMLTIKTSNPQSLKCNEY